ncbi:MAG TPA: DUF456 domain-containing protein [Anaerolineaceae bacterium]
MGSSIGLVTLQIVLLVVMLVGLLGLLTTIIPGLVIIWLAVLVYWIVAGFTPVSWALFALITLLMIFGSVIDNIMMGASARRTGASWLAVAVALTAGVAGSLAFPPFGGLVAALLGLFLVEFARLRNWRMALDSTRSMAAGCGWSVLIRFGIGMIMILIWGGWVLLAK